MGGSREATGELELRKRLVVREHVRWKPNPLCSKPHDLWTAPDLEATEVEVTHLVAALVGVVKPGLVVETGTYQAHTTHAIADALPPGGLVHTFESDPAAFRAVRDLPPSVVRHLGRLQDTALDGVEFAFLDSGMHDRGQELAYLQDRLSPGALVVVHDAARNRPPGQAPIPAGWAVLEFGTPRGLIVLQKPWR